MLSCFFIAHYILSKRFQMQHKYFSRPRIAGCSRLPHIFISHH